MNVEQSPEDLYLHYYTDLRRLANQYLQGERPGHTLQPTALVHELWVKISKGKPMEFNDPQHFFATSARMMRQLLVDHARKKDAKKRQAPDHELTISTENGQISLLELEDSLKQLEALSPRAAQIVELRFFAGLKNEEITKVLDISLPTVKRDWQLAKAFLKIELKA